MRFLFWCICGFWVVLERMQVRKHGAVRHPSRIGISFKEPALPWPVYTFSLHLFGPFITGFCVDRAYSRLHFWLCKFTRRSHRAPSLQVLRLPLKVATVRFFFPLGLLAFISDLYLSMPKMKFLVPFVAGLLSISSVAASPYIPLDKRAVSTDGSCGGSQGLTCKGSGFGDCCSQYGYCGSATAYVSIASYAKRIVC